MPPLDFSALIQVGTLIAVVVTFIFTTLKVRRTEEEIEGMRQNDMHALGMRLDRIESKIDQHLTFHASKQS